MKFTTTVLVAMFLVSCGEKEDKKETAQVQNQEEENQVDQMPVAQTGYLALDLSNISGLAVTQAAGSGLNLQGSSPELKTLSETGGLTSAWKEGNASVKDFKISPDSKIYLLFNEKVPYVEKPDGAKLLLTQAEEEIEYEYCVLGEVLASGDVTCVDNELAHVGAPEDIQFDDQGSLYYFGKTDSSQILRKKIGDDKTDLINENIEIDQFVVTDESSVLISSVNNWGRKITPNGSLKTFFDGNMGDMYPTANNEYVFGVSGGIKTYNVGLDQITSTIDVKDLEGYDFEDSLFVNSGKEFHTTSNGKTYYMFQDDMYVLGSLTPVATLEVKKVTNSWTILDSIFLAVVDTDSKHTLLQYNTDTGVITKLLDKEMEVYDISFAAKTNTLLINGLDFETNKNVLGRLNMTTKKLNATPMTDAIKALSSF